MYFISFSCIDWVQHLTVVSTMFLRFQLLLPHYFFTPLPLTEVTIAFSVSLALCVSLSLSLSASFPSSLIGNTERDPTRHFACSALLPVHTLSSPSLQNSAPIHRLRHGRTSWFCVSYFLTCCSVVSVFSRGRLDVNPFLRSIFVLKLMLALWDLKKKKKKQEEGNEWSSMQRTYCVSRVHCHPFSSVQVYVCVDVWQRSVWGQAPRPPCQDEQPRKRTQGLTVSQSQLSATAVCTWGEEVQKQDHLNVCLRERWERWSVTQKTSIAVADQHIDPPDFYLQEAGRRTGTRTGLRSPPRLTLNTPSMWALTRSLESSLWVSDLKTVQCAAEYRHIRNHLKLVIHQIALHHLKTHGWRLIKC